MSQEKRALPPARRRLTIASDDPFANIFINNVEGMSFDREGESTPPEEKAKKLARKLAKMQKQIEK